MGSLFRNHHVRRLDDGDRIISGTESEIIDRFVGDRGCNDDAVADIDPHMRGCGAAAHLDDLAAELIARAELHLGLRSLRYGSAAITYPTDAPVPTRARPSDFRAGLGAGLCRKSRDVAGGLCRGLA